MLSDLFFFSFFFKQCGTKSDLQKKSETQWQKQNV